VRAGIESKPARTTILTVRRVNILEVLPLIARHARILEAGTIFQPPNIASEHAGSASLKATHEHILAIIFIPVLHSRYFGSSPFFNLAQPQQDESRPVAAG
jgi:hypothetical protein